MTDDSAADAAKLDEIEAGLLEFGYSSVKNRKAYDAIRALRRERDDAREAERDANGVADRFAVKIHLQAQEIAKKDAALREVQQLVRMHSLGLPEGYSDRMVLSALHRLFDAEAALAPAAQATPCPKCGETLDAVCKRIDCARLAPAPSAGETDRLRDFAAMLSEWKDAHHDCDCPPHHSCGCRELRQIILQMELAAAPAPSAGETVLELAEALVKQLIALGVGGCTCGVKSPQAHWHEPTCTFRRAEEALENAEAIRALAAAPTTGEPCAALDDNRDPMDDSSWFEDSDMGAR
jgi:hypothetical protein